MSRFFYGPTNDVNTAFIHKTQELLESSRFSASSFEGPGTVALKSSPIYNAIIRFAKETRDEELRQRQQEHHAGDVSASPSTSVVPSALARRGLCPKDPLLQRKLRKQQQLQQTRQKVASSDSLSVLLAADSNDSSCEGVQVASHWSKRPLREMTQAGWDVFREQIGVFVEIVLRRGADEEEHQQRQQQQRHLLKFTPATLRPIRCWEEAYLPLALGTVVARRYLLPTPIQSQCVPLAMAVVATPSGKVDVLGVAETGSGKTAAYLIPLLADVLRRTPRLIGNDDLIAHGPLALVMVPTRELAEQVTREALAFTRGLPDAELRRLVSEEYMDDGLHDVGSAIAMHNTLDEVRVVKIVGGEQAESQYNDLAQGAHVVVGTLGQLESLLQQRFLALGNTRLVVMDEVDRMIEEHQKDRLIAVLERCPLPRQTIMFTATLSATCEEVAQKYFSPAGFVVVRVPARCSTITQVMELMPSDPSVPTTFSLEAVENKQTASVENDHRHGSGCNDKIDQLHGLERRRNSLLHPVKFARLVAYLAYATPPVVVFVNEKRTCDLLYDELRAEAASLGALADDFSLETLVGEIPPALCAKQHGDGCCYHHHDNNDNKNLSFQQRHVKQRVTVPNLGNMRSVALVHSEQSQAERQRLLELFRGGERRVLLTTDLLSRGLDVPNVSLVINYDLPKVATAVSTITPATAAAGEEAVQRYIHRIGRTGRAGASGTAVSFLCLSSLLIQRAQHYVQRGASSSSHSSDRGEVASGRVLDVGVPGVSGKTKREDFEKTQLMGPKSSKDLYEGFFTVAAADTDDDDDDDDTEAERPRAQRRTEYCGAAVQKNLNNSSCVFLGDELLLKPLWKFFVDCAEASCKNSGGAELICQRRCPHIQLPHALVVLMMAFARGSPYGSLTA